jgi:hypothetical protein
MIAYVIYGLIDPNTKELRYIGKTKNLKDRIYNHYKKEKLKPNTYKNNWLKSLLKLNQRAEIIVLV